MEAFSIVTGLKSVPFMEGVGSRILMYGTGPPETCSAAVMHGVSVVAIWRIGLEVANFQTVAK